MCRPQLFSHYPSWPAPVRISLATVPEHSCAYFPDRSATIRAFRVEEMSPDVYHAFMDAGFRRSGNVIYQPACGGCRLCLPIRVLVPAFTATKSQRRSIRRNDDLQMKVAKPVCTDEKYDLYCRYLAGWHDRDVSHESFETFQTFLYESPVNTVEFEYRDKTGRLLAVGICDVCAQSLSSVYFYFDPAERRRSLGTFGALREIAYAELNGLPYYYLGYWISGCRSMEYKCSFSPYELLGTDGIWRRSAATATTTA